MNKYLVKPTFLHDKNGKKFSVEELLSDGNHEGGSSSGSTVDSTQLKALETRVTTLESNDENIGRQVANNQSTCENALREAQIAHNVASEVAESLDMVRSTADNAESKAVEAKAVTSSLSTGYENLKTRVTHLEETAGTATVESVGRSIMGYNADFTEYGGGTYKTVEWGDEGNTVTFSREDTLGDLLEHMIYYTTTGITSNYNRIKALEQNGTGSGEHTSCLDQDITLQPFQAFSDEGLAFIGKTDKNETTTDDVKSTLTIATQSGLAAAVEAKLNQNKIAGLTTQVETLDSGLYNTAKNVLQIETRVTTLETSIGSLGTFNITEYGVGKDMYNHYGFTQPTMMSTDDMSLIHTVIDANFSAQIDMMNEHCDRLSTLETKASTQATSISSLETRMLDVETKTNGNSAQCGCDAQAITNLQADCQELSNYTTSNVTNLHAKLKELRNQMVADLDWIWSELKRIHTELPDINTNDANRWNVCNVDLI